MKDGLNIINIGKSYKNGGNETVVFNNFSLRIQSRTITSIVGPSGSGKTTLLNLIARLETPDSGQITLGDLDRSIGYMMQDSLLLPWRTLEENAVLGAELAEPETMHLYADAKRYFYSFGLAGFEPIYPGAASAGMKQRVAIIRTLLTNPTVILLDEPFSNLDFDIKLEIQKVLMSYHYERRTTIVLVTHDIEDAIALSDTVVVLSNRPASIKTTISIDTEATKKDPIEARMSVKFSEYFRTIWKHLQYVNHE